MAIKVKAIERKLKVGASAGQFRYIMQAIGEVIKAWATEGHSVAIPGLGTMRFGVRATSVADVNMVGADLITSRRVIFTPNSDIKEELRKASISITCYNRNGELVKRVTSTDDAEIEDPEDEDPVVDDTQNGNGTQPGNGDGNDANAGNGEY